VRATTVGVLSAGLCAAASALAAFEPSQVSGDLDGDPGVEKAHTVSVSNPDEPDSPQTAVYVSDSCSPSDFFDTRITRTQDSLGFLKLVHADTRPGSEVYVDLRSGATGRSGEARVVAWRPAGGKVCRVPRQLFRYASDRPTHLPHGARYLASFSVEVKSLTRRFKGREVRLNEGFARRGEALCCPSIFKRTSYRYDADSDRYRLYKIFVLRKLPNR
jgi:hypothetical protein